MNVNEMAIIMAELYKEGKEKGSNQIVNLECQYVDDLTRFGALLANVNADIVIYVLSNWDEFGERLPQDIHSQIADLTERYVRLL